jgi:hypothetical protein
MTENEIRLAYTSAVFQCDWLLACAYQVLFAAKFPGVKL